MKKDLKVILFLLCMISFSVNAQEKHALYTGVIPNSKTSSVQETFANGMYRGVTVPELEVFLPDKEKATGAAVVICPGGGYSVVVYQGEGVTTAKAFAERGIAAFVLKYRLPDDNTMLDKKTGPLQDAQQAIKVARENASKWGINPNKIGIMGFSAGGHLASTAATRFSPALVENSSNTSLRPDFQVLVYPVISMQDNLTHAGSKQQLLGSNPDQVVLDLFSSELQVDENTPPAYITHAADDKLVDVDNSINYFEQLRKHGVSVEMHIYPKGGHGFVFGMKDWMDPLFVWMKRIEIISN